MKKITFEKHYLFLIALFLFAINNVTAQGCIVSDDLTPSQRTALDITNQPFQSNQNVFLYPFSVRLWIIS